MATINLSEAMAWLKKMEEQSNINRQRFAARPSVPASQAWSGYRDRPGGQRLMVRQPEIDNTLTVKNDGTQTLVKKWKDPDASVLKATGLGGSGGSHPIYQQPWAARKAYFGDNQGIRNMAMSQEEGLFRNDLPSRNLGFNPKSLANLGIPIRAIGDIINRMQRGYQGIDDRIERNRINRLMRFRTRNPYYGSRGIY
jgi:uncharacterized glyoxalase superfamily protein PhnB